MAAQATCGGVHTKIRGPPKELKADKEKGKGKGKGAHLRMHISSSLLRSVRCRNHLECDTRMGEAKPSDLWLKLRMSPCLGVDVSSCRCQRFRWGHRCCRLVSLDSRQVGEGPKDAGESSKQPKITDLMLPSKAPAPASGELALAFLYQRSIRCSHTAPSMPAPLLQH